jgi:hypothetical protein
MGANQKYKRAMKTPVARSLRLMHPLRDIEEVAQPTRTCCFPFGREVGASIGFILIERASPTQSAPHSRDVTARRERGSASTPPEMGPDPSRSAPGREWRWSGIRW